jgi:hypothetical protein
VDPFSDHEDQPEPDGFDDGARVLRVEEGSGRQRQRRAIALISITLVALVLALLAWSYIAPEIERRRPAQGRTGLPVLRSRKGAHRAQMAEHHHKVVVRSGLRHPPGRLDSERTKGPGPCGLCRGATQADATQAGQSSLTVGSSLPPPTSSTLTERTASEFGFERWGAR